MIRPLVFLLIALLAVAAFAASENAQPVIDDHSSGRWDFNNADYSPGIRDDARVWLQVCVPIIPTAPIRPVGRNKGVHQT